MQEVDAHALIGRRVRIASDDYAYDALEGEVTGLGDSFGPTLYLDVAGRRYFIALEDIGAAQVLKPYRVVVAGVELPAVVAVDDSEALLKAQERAAHAPGAIYEVWSGRRFVGWVSDDAQGLAG